jgi:hypothetical protein
MANANIKTFTYQTRIKDINPLLAEFLSDYAQLYGKIERKLFADYCRGINILQLKATYLKTYGITAITIITVKYINNKYKVVGCLCQ